MKKTHLTIICSLSGITGIIIGLTSPNINIPYFLLFVAFLLFIFINLYIKIIHPIYLLIILVLIFGIWRAQDYLHQLFQSNISQIMGTTEIIGTIIYPPEINNNSQKIIISDIKQNNQTINGRILIKLNRYPSLQYNDIIAISGQFEQIENFDEQFSYTGYLSLKNVLALSNYPEVNVVGRAPPNIYFYLYRLKNHLLQLLKESLPAHSAGLLAGLLLGEKKILPNSIYQQFIDLGLSHIIVVSGYNLTLFSQLFNHNLTSLIHRRTAYWLTVVFMIAFTIITGAEASIVRALIMSVMMISAPMFSRLPNHINAVLLAAVIMIFTNPLIIFYDIGFHLSFLATLGLIFISPILTQLSSYIKLPEIIKSTALETTAATLATLPYSIYQFGRLQLYLLPANLIILPLTGITTLTGIGFVVLATLSPYLANLILLPLNILLQTILGFADKFSRLPFTTLPININQITMLVTYFIMFVLIFYLRRRQTDHAIIVNLKS